MSDTILSPDQSHLNAPEEAASASDYPKARRIGAVNWVGLQTLTSKEIERFAKLGVQTILAPVVTSLLFFSIFSLALGGVVRQSAGVPFLQFLVPGLIAMNMLQNAFANTSSSLMISKMQGNIVDVLMPPISYLEMTIAYVTGGVVRGIVCGLAVFGALWVLDFFVNPEILGELHWSTLFYVGFHGIMGSMMLSLLGLATGIWAEKFDHIAAVTNFLVTPMTFLSGTFYTIDRLPENFQFVAHFNPFFYVIDGFRYGFIGISDPTFVASLPVGIAVVFATNLALSLLCVWMLATGYKLRS